MSTLALVLILILLFGGIGTGPWFPHAASWGYGGPGLFGVLIIVVLVLALTGRL